MKNFKERFSSASPAANSNRHQFLRGLSRSSLSFATCKNGTGFSVRKHLRCVLYDIINYTGEFRASKVGLVPTPLAIHESKLSL